MRHDICAKRVGVTAGAKQALYNAAMVLCNPGDDDHNPETILGNVSCSSRAGWRMPVYVDTHRPVTNCLAADQLKRRSLRPPKRSSSIAPIIQPGLFIEPESLSRIAELAFQRKIWIVFDECYSELVRNGAYHRNVVQLLEAVKPQSILVNSFSKSYGVTGWRIGYAYGPKEAIAAMENFKGIPLQIHAVFRNTLRCGASKRRWKIHNRG